MTTLVLFVYSIFDKKYRDSRTFIKTGIADSAIALGLLVIGLIFK